MKLKFPVRRFLLFSAGISLDQEMLLSDRERYRQSAVGMAVVLTALLATLSGGYTFSWIFVDEVVAIASLACLWGLIIYNLDRLLVMSIDQAKSRTWPQLLLRLSLAIVIALLVSRPVELRLFEAEISAVINQSGEEDRATLNKDHQGRLDLAEERRKQDRKLVGESSQVDYLKTQELAKQSELRDCEGSVEDLDLRVLAEADGTQGTGEIGCSTECKRKKIAARKMEAHCVKLESALATISKNLALEHARLKTDRENLGTEDIGRIKELDRKYQSAFAKIQYEIPKSFLTRHKTLAKLSEDPDIQFLVVVITALFILLEISPIGAKLLTPSEPSPEREEMEAIGLRSALRIKKDAVAVQMAELDLAELHRDKQLAEARAELESKELILRLKTQKYNTQIRELIEGWQPGEPNDDEHHQNLEDDFERVWELAMGLRQQAIERIASFGSDRSGDTIPPPTVDSKFGAMKSIFSWYTPSRELSEETGSINFLIVGSSVVFATAVTAWFAMEVLSWENDPSIGLAGMVLTFGTTLFLSQRTRAGSEAEE